MPELQNIQEINNKVGTILGFKPGELTWFQCFIKMSGDELLLTIKVDSNSVKGKKIRNIVKENS